MINKKSDSKTNGIFKLGTVENFKRTIKGYSILFTYMVIFTYTALLTSTELFTYIVWWCGIDRWRDNILLDQWCGVDRWYGRMLLDKMLMWHWLMMCKSYWAEMLKWCWLMMCSNQSKLAPWRNPKSLNYFHLMSMIHLLYL